MAQEEHVLIVDDDAGMRLFCLGTLRKAGFTVEEAVSAEAATEMLRSHHFGIVLTDLHLPGMDGLEFTRRVYAEGRDTDVIIMSADPSIDAAVSGLKMGAHDFLVKPLDGRALIGLVERLAERRSAMAQNLLARQEAESSCDCAGLIGTSRKMRELQQYLIKIGAKRFPVLITGESGTGKEMVARALHSCGPNKSRPFVPVDCGALTPNLIESELFGHVRGSYTGATQDRAGLFRTAGDGTVFLDEIGELPAEMQVKLLRVLQENEFRAVGSDVRIPLRARVVAATNRDLEAAIKEKQFRADLFYRLNVLAVKLAPLRTRKDDIVPLAQHFLSRHGDGNVLGLAAEATERLMSYDWPGNARELENCIRHAIAVTDGPWIEVRDFPYEVRASEIQAMQGRPLTYLEQVERRAILEVLESTSGQRVTAAKLLGIGKTTLYSKLKEYGIEDVADRAPVN
jgi:DNA-binding NtrC family response regulator